MRALALGGLAAIVLCACLEDEVPVVYPDGYGSDGGTTMPDASGGTTSSSGVSSSGGTSSGNTSSSGQVTPPPPPPAPVVLPMACFRDGQVLPAGPAPSELAGDCFHDGCDGVSRDGLRTFDATDVKRDDNPCIEHACTTTGATQKTAANGKACGADGGICFQGKCATCKPANPASCAAEGGNEPANDQPSTATSYTEYSTVCGFSSDADVDWYTFYANDASFVTDIFDFDVWSTAPNIEVCIYVKCGSGFPSGCSGGKVGPNGSYGCCWSGAPSEVRPRWDMDCSGTSEDSGTTYVSVRTPGGDACEPYLISGHY